MASLHDIAEDLARAADTGTLEVRRQVMLGATKELEEGARANLTARLRERSRALLTSLRRTVRLVDGDVVGEVSAGGNVAGLRVPYARIHEYGGTIVPVRGEYLAIPVGPALNSIGRARYESARQAPGLTFLTSRKGNLLLVKTKPGKEGGEPGIEVWYVLRRSVTLPARRYLRDAQAVVIESLPDRLAAAAAHVFRRAAA